MSAVLCSPARLVAPTALVLLLALALPGCDRGSHPGQIGHPAPDFVIHDGPQTVQLSAYQGKVVLLVFWATWCQPCLDEIPSLAELQRTHPQMVVLTVDTDDDRAAYRQFLEQNRIDLLSIHDEEQSSNKLYGTFRFPESYLIDRRGILRRKFIGPQDWTSPDIMAYFAHF